MNYNDYWYHFILSYGKSSGAGLYIPLTTIWSRSYGSRDIFSTGLNFYSFRFSISEANTTSGGFVESTQDALIDITKCPLFLTNIAALRPKIRA